jgi:Ca2+-binding RTX toxin-like protein
MTKILGTLLSDMLSGSQGSDTLYGGGSEVASGDWADTILAGGGDDLIYGNGGGDVLLGELGMDTLYGGVGADALYGGRGQTDAEDADDALYGNAGTDILFGNAGRDLLQGGDGADSIWGGLGNDLIYGGNHFSSAGDGSDWIAAGSGSDTVYGNEGADTIFGGNGVSDPLDDADTIYGGSGSDIMYGNGGDDLLQGDEGNDTLYGGSGADTLDGGAGDDVYVANVGDLVIGGAGVDRFVLHAPAVALNITTGAGVQTNQIIRLVNVERGEQIRIINADGHRIDIVNRGDGADILVDNKLLADVSGDAFQKLVQETRPQSGGETVIYVNKPPEPTTSGGTSNTAPILADLDAATFLENTVNASAQLIDSAVTLTDDSTHFSGGNLTVTYSAGGSTEDSLSIRNQGAGAGQIGVSGTTVTYDGIAMGTITTNGASGASLVISFNANATPIAVDALIENLTYANSSNAPAATREISITVNDGSLASTVSTAILTVTAENDAPVNTVPAAQTTNEDTNKTFNSAGGNLISVSEPDGDALAAYTLAVSHGTLTLTQTTGLTFAAGDGTSDTTMTFSGTAANINAAINGLVYTSNTNYNGADTLTITADDGTTTDVDTVGITVTAVNDAPINAVPAAQTTNEDTSKTFNTAGGNLISVSDVESASLTAYTLTVTQGTLTLAQTIGLTFASGDGTNDATMTFSGTIANINAALDGLIYAPTTNYNGSDTLTLTTNDGTATDVDTVGITVTSVNDAPVNSVPAAQTTNEDTNKTFNTAGGNLISVSDVDGTPLTAYTLAVTQGTLTLAQTTGLTFATGDGTSDATITFSGTIANINAALNGLIYAPTANYNGADTLTLTANDGTATDVDTVGITVTAVADAPVNSLPGAQTTNEDTNTTFNTAGANLISVSDADNASLTAYTLAVTHGTLTLAQTTGLTFTTGDGTSDATMTFSGTVANINTALDGLIYAPTSNYNGAETLTLTANDGTATDVDTVGITVTSINDTPTVNNPLLDRAATEDTAFSYTFAGITFGDVDTGDTKTYSVTSTLPSWLSFNATTRTFSGTPANGDVGIVDVTLRNTDSSGAYVEDTFRITTTNTNDAPTVANALVDQAATEDSGFNYQFASNSFADVDASDTLTYSVTSALPGWLSFNAATRTFSGTPANGDVGNVDITVRATDGSASFVEDTFRITTANTNDAPTVANALVDQTANQDVSFSYQFTSNSFSDVDSGDTLTYSVTSALPAWLNFNATTRTFSGTPAVSDVGNLDITVRATDSVAAYVEDTVRVTVASTILGTAAADTLAGGAGSQAIDGLADNDVIYADLAPATMETLFTPENIGGLQLWLDAQSITGLANGATVSSWTDISGASHTAATSGNDPLYSAAGINSLPSVSFGTTSYLIAPSFAVRNVFAVAKSNNAIFGDYEGILGGPIGNTNNGHLVNGWAGSTEIRYGAAAHPLARQNGTVAASGIFQNINAASGWIGSFDLGVTHTNSEVWIGRISGGNRAWNGQIGEILAYSGTISTAGRELIEAYQSDHWNIALTATGAVAETPSISAETCFITRTAAEDILVGAITADLGDATPTYSIASGNTSGIFRISDSGEIYIDNAAALAGDGSTTYTLGVEASLGGDPLAISMEIKVRAQNSDTIAGGDGNDTVTGSLGGDSLSGDNGNDVIYGDSNQNIGGNDTIDGGAGNDTLYGYTGNDIITGGTGDDVLYADSDLQTSEALFEPDNVSGLALWLDGSDSSTLFADTAGTTAITDGAGVALWRDKSGNNNHATQSTAGSRPTWSATGQNGAGALGFDGNADHLAINDANSLDLTTGFTLGMWAKSAGAQSNRYLLSKRTDGGGDNVYSVIYGYTANHAQLYASGNTWGYPAHNSDISYADNDWHLLTYTYNGTTFASYRDGSLSNSFTLTSPLTASTSNLLIATFNAAGFYFGGSINDIFMYNNGLSSDLVSLLYATQSHEYGAFSDGYTVARNAADNTLIGDIREDLGSISYSYSITSGNALGIFRIDAATGKIYVDDDVALAADDRSSYTLGVQVTLGSGGNTLALDVHIGVKSSSQNGNDTLSGGDGNDTLYGSSGNNQLNGDADNDTIYGNGGVDTITGGTGQDTMSGGIGSDRFTFTATTHSPSGTPDTITNFDAAADLLVFTGLLAGTFSFIGAHSNVFAGGGNSSARFNDTADLLEIDTNGDAATDMAITLTNVALADLSAADFSWS